FDLELLRFSHEPSAQSGKQKAASRPHSVRPESAQPGPDSSKFDVARVDPERASVFAGRAPPNAEVTVLANGQIVATTKADENGQWAIAVEHPFAPGEYELSLRTGSAGSLTQAVGGSVHITIAANDHVRPALAPSPMAVTERNDATPPSPIIFD